jgi:hypothetical protein
VVLHVVEQLDSVFTVTGGVLSEVDPRDRRALVAELRRVERVIPKMIREIESGP